MILPKFPKQSSALTQLQQPLKHHCSVFVSLTICTIGFVISSEYKLLELILSVTAAFRVVRFAAVGIDILNEVSAKGANVILL